MGAPLRRRAVLKAAGSMTLLNLAAFSTGATKARALAGAQDRHGPLRVGRFRVEIDDVEVPGWRSVTIPSSSTEAGDYREGNDPEYEQSPWGETTFDDLEMERGLQPDDTRLFDWREDVRAGNVDEGRKEVAVELLDEEGEPRIRWEFQNAWITEYHPPALEADADDAEVATESIAVSFETMTADWDPDGPEGEFAIEPDPAVVGQEVTFDASETESADAIDGFEWEFGDGTTETGVTVAHTYENSGEYTVALTVERGENAETTEEELTVQPDDGGDPNPERTLSYYADDDGVVRLGGATEAVEDWEGGLIDTALLLDVINAWQAGEPVDETG